MKKLYFTIFIFLLQAFSVQFAQAQANKSTFIKVTPNLYAPELYAEKIALQIMLVNLPGLEESRSSFQGSYNIYFIPEDEIGKQAQSRGGVINQLKPGDISNKIFISTGKFNKTQLSSNRVFEKNNILFRSKVPDKLRMMRGNIVIFYSIKIYDGKLKKSVYRDSSFIYFPFETENTNNARKTFHISFFVNEGGKLYTSSLPREKTTTIW